MIQRLVHWTGRLERSLEEGPLEGRGHRLATWWMGMRWIAVAGSAVVIAYTTKLTGTIPAETASRLWIGVAALALFNGALAVRGERPSAWLRAQVVVDVAILGWLVHHAGGLANPFSGFFCFHAVIAAVVFERRRARGIAVGIAAFVLGLAALEATATLPPGCVHGADGGCVLPAGPALTMAAGVAVATSVIGCGSLVVALVGVIHHERSEVERQRKNLQHIVDCMADGVLFVTPDGVVQMRNRAATRLWPDGDPPGTLRACHTPETWELLLERVLRPAAVEHHPVLAVGNRSYEASWAPVMGDDRALRGVVMVARDVTERIAAQKTRLQEQRMAVVGKLAAGLAHELNNPLGAIVLFAQDALGSVPGEHPLALHLGTVLRNAKLCKKIVKDLLEYARQRPPERRCMAIAELVDDVLRTLEQRAAAAGVTLERRIEPGAPATIHGDPDQLLQVLVNLGLNGIEAMAAGGKLTLRVAPAPGGRLRVDVIDTGPGIPAPELERIFTEFHTTKPEGTGLGLTVARDLTQAHGGTLEVASTPGAGATFTVLLPAAEEAA